MFKATATVFAYVSTFLFGYYLADAIYDAGAASYRAQVAEACDPGCWTDRSGTTHCKLIPFDCWDIP